MIRRIVPAAVAATGLVATMLAAAPGASAGTSGLCTITDYSPRTVVVGLSTAYKTFGVSTTGCTVQAWQLDFGSGLVLDQANRQLSFDPRTFYNADAGVRFGVTVHATDQNGDETVREMANSFVVKRRTEWRSFNASPEPVSKGKPVKITGALKVADWNVGKYLPQKGSTVSVQFKKAGTSSYVTVKTVKTSSTSGTVSTSVNATYDGRWRLVYGGSGTRGPATSLSDYVDVR